ncbi:MAG TPA: TonB-dependent receptor [Acidobacteriota bacterium]|nr:TonB-dependent receptor [Acidobacteriota bacterium]
MFRRLFFLSFFLLVSGRPLFPAELTGRVVDLLQAGIEGVRVTLTSRDGQRAIVVSTDPNGRFVLDRLTGGDFLLELHQEGFAPKILSLSLSAEETRDVQLQLNLARVSNQIVVTATGTAQSVEETSKSMSVVDSNLIEKRNVYELGEALRAIPGMRVQQSGGPMSFSSIRMRGLRNQDTALLLDGVRFRDPSSLDGDATSFVQDFVLLNAERIEVLRGSGSSNHGTHAIGGAVNLISRTGGGPLAGRLRLEGGGLGLFRGIGTFEGGTPDGRLMYSGGLTHLNMSGGLDDHDQKRNSSGMLRLQWNLSPRLNLIGRFYGGETFSQENSSPAGIPENAGDGAFVPARPLSETARGALERGESPEFGDATFIPDLDDPDSRRTGRFSSSLLRLSHQLTPRVGYTAHYHHVGTSRQFEDGPLGLGFQPAGPAVSEFDGGVHTMGVRLDVLAGRRHLLSGGYEFESERARTLDLGPGGSFRTRLTETSHSLFVQDQMLFLDERLQLSLSGRAQLFSLSEPDFAGDPGPFQNIGSFLSPPTALTADGSISYRVPGTRTKFRSHVGNGYRAPSLFNRFGSSFFLGFVSFFGDPGLRPERSISVDAGIDQWLFEDRLLLSGTYFYTRLQEVIGFEFGGLIDPATDPFGRFGGYLNARGGLARGVESSVQFRPHPGIHLQGAYTFTDSRSAPGTTSAFGRALGVSRHHFGFSGVVQPHPRFDVAYHLERAGHYFIQFFEVNRPYRFQGPFRSDLSLRYLLPAGGDYALRLTGKISNLTDREYFENGFRTPGIFATAGLQFEF